MNVAAAPVDPDGLMEFSVVFTDRSLNHMSKVFQGVMNDLYAMLTEVYGAEAAVIVPGGGTYAMEAVARQFATDAKAMVIRNGWFSYRWTQIFEMGAIPSETVVVKARQVGNESTSAFAPDAADALAARIREERPGVVFAPHVETASGVILPDGHIKAIADAAHEVGALFVLDCVASGSIWVDMASTGVDVLISAPQKGWSASPAAGLVMLSPRALERLGETTSTSFAIDLRKWHDIMQAYVNGGHAYHATMPTDALKVLRDRMVETRDFGFELARERQWELGRKVRALLAANGYASVAAPGFEAPGVVVSYTKDPDIQNGKKFVAEGMQIAAGVPLMCDEPADFRTFRVGLFGLDKLADVDGTVARLEAVLETIAEG
ncbi:aminotransferase class V-fold PLP-dependent enzyme [Oricola sp.]|uniref:aminotransferase class V-fold PLP-dependent enzyme n=1 Tax=Oricola sp. TaxID=1979950 RepID=UPI0025E5F6AE|nr:aminotransferase class V-fold PLP-dependent enzyme [Oricola sp.]MCI5078194.1 aminotransferase class V-fold PLP-dependent enzyme [Oricola sp.]